MIPLSISPDLMEEAVLLAERQADRDAAGRFRRERDLIYEIADPEAREARFHELAIDWFSRFGLRSRLDRAVNGRTALARHLRGARIVRAIKRSAEGADLVDAAGRDRTDPRPWLVVRLTPESLLAPDALERLLGHELMHIADMLDPSFGYERTLPPSDGGPSADNLLRDRYRVAWDVTIDGRLAAAGRGHPGARDARWREFQTTFGMLGDRCQDAFDAWWNRPHPTHTDLLAFATAPGGEEGQAAGRCPLCRFPVAALDPRVSTLVEPVVRRLQIDYPSWRVEHGICPQCFDLYEARYGSIDAVRC